MNLSLGNNDLGDIVNSDRNHVWHHLSQHKRYEASDPLMIIEGKGMRVWDANGKEYLDGVSGGVWTVNVGYGRESIADAVRDQLVKMNYFAHSAGNVPAALFAEKLIEKMPGMSRVYYSNSGSEANEKAYKIVRQIAHDCFPGTGLSWHDNHGAEFLWPESTQGPVWPLYPGLCGSAPLHGIPLTIWSLFRLWNKGCTGD